jgi:hypothetical protein
VVSPPDDLEAMTTTAHKKPGKMETRLSMVVMALVMVVGAGVVMRQFTDQSGGGRPAAGIPPAPLPPRNQPALIDTTGSGYHPFSPPERFGPDTLYEKINGRADLYLSSGFVSLNTQRFAMDSTAGAWVEVFVYDMATPENAFSVFSMQRREGARADRRRPQCLPHGKRPVHDPRELLPGIIGTDASAGLQQAMGTGWPGAFVESHGGTLTAAACTRCRPLSQEGLNA